MPDLTPQQLTQLDTNIKMMLENGGSQADVENYARDFREKYDVQKKKNTESSNGSEDLLTPQQPLTEPLSKPINQDRNGYPIAPESGSHEWYAQHKARLTPVGDYNAINKSIGGSMGKGNINLDGRKVYLWNDNQGNYSSLESMSFEEDGKEVLIPKISEDGRLFSNQEAINQYKKTGKYLGKFNSPEESDKYAIQLERRQQAYYEGTPEGNNILQIAYNSKTHANQDIDLSPTSLIKEFGGGGSAIQSGIKNTLGTASKVNAENPYKVSITDVSGVGRGNVIGKEQGKTSLVNELTGIYHAIDALPRSPTFGGVENLAAKSFVNSTIMALEGMKDIPESITDLQYIKEDPAIVAEFPEKVVQTVFGVLGTVLPPLVAFNTAIEGVKEVAPSEYVEITMSPFASGLEHGVFIMPSIGGSAPSLYTFDKTKVTKGMKALGSFGDLIYQGALLKGFHSLASKIKTDSPLTTPEEKHQMAEVVDDAVSKRKADFSVETLEKIPEETPVEKVIEIAPLIEKKQNIDAEIKQLQSEKATIDESFHEQKDQQIAEAEKIKTDTNEEIKFILDSKDKTEPIELPVEAEKVVDELGKHYQDTIADVKKQVDRGSRDANVQKANEKALQILEESKNLDEARDRFFELQKQDHEKFKNSSDKEQDANNRFWDYVDLHIQGAELEARKIKEPKPLVEENKGNVEKSADVSVEGGKLQENTDMGAASILGKDTDLKGGQKFDYFKTKEEVLDERASGLTDYEKQQLKDLRQKRKEMIENHGTRGLANNPSNKMLGGLSPITQELSSVRGKISELEKKQFKLKEERAKIEAQHKNTVKNYLDIYETFIKSGQLTASDAVAIIKSAKLEVPKEILDLQKSEITNPSYMTDSKVTKNKPKSKPTPTESAPTGIRSDVKGDVDLKGNPKEEFMKLREDGSIPSTELIKTLAYGKLIGTERRERLIDHKSDTHDKVISEMKRLGADYNRDMTDKFTLELPNGDIVTYSQIEVGTRTPKELQGKWNLSVHYNRFNEIKDALKPQGKTRVEGKVVDAPSKFEKAIEEGKMTAHDAVKVIESAGLKVPTSILKKAVAELEAKENAKSETPTPQKEGESILKVDDTTQLPENKPIATKEVPRTKFQLAKEKASESLKAAKEYRKSKNENLGAVKDPLKEAKKQAELDRKAFDDLVDVAREAVNEGIKSVKDFAKELGEEVSDLVQKAWDVANKVAKYEDAVREVEQASKPLEIKGDGGKPKAILNRLHESEFITYAQKKRLEAEGLEYKPKSHEEARTLAKAVVKEYGTENAVALAEAGKFDGDVNSLIFAEAIDATYFEGKKAKTEAERLALDEQWADYSIRYDEAGRKGGRFSSAIYDFYKKSPVGIKIKEQRIREGVFKDWYKSKEQNFKEFWEEVSQQPEFKEAVTKEAGKIVEQKSFKERAKKVADNVRKLKTKPLELKDENGNPIIISKKGIDWNDLVEGVAKSIEAAGSLADGISKYLEKQKWYESLTDKGKDAVQRQLAEHFESADAPKKKITKEDENKIVEKWSKKLKSLPTEKREQFIRDIIKAVVQKGELSYVDFKNILSDATGMGKITAKEGQMIDKYVEAANKVTDLADKAQSEGTPKAIKEWEGAVREAERTATDLADIVYKEANLTNRVTSLISLNTLGFGTLIKNIGYNIAQQALIRFPKALIGTAVDYTAYGVSLAANKVFGSPILKPETNVFLAQRGYFRNLALGTKDVSVKIRRGGTYKDYFQQGIQHPRIKPLKSIRDLRDWRFGRGDKFLTSKQVTDKVLQATSGIPAEIIARGLLTGDTPPRWAAEGAKAEQLARLKFGISGNDKAGLELFRKFPEEQAKKKFLERGLSEEQAQKKAADVKKQILEAGDDATLTMENLATDLVNAIKQWGEGLSKDSAGGELANTVGRLAGVLNIPYLKIPINAAWLAMNIRNPIIPMVQSAYYGAQWARTRNPVMARKAKDWLNIAAVGVATNTVAAWMVNNLIVTARTDDDETKKEGDITTEFDRQYSMNVNKLMRGGGETEDGDVSIDLSWFGGQGAVLNTAAQQRERELDEGEMSAMDEMAFNLSRGGIEGFTSSVFGTTNALINAYTMGGGYVHQLGLQYFNTAANVVEPAMIAQVSKNGFGRNLDIRGDSFGDALSKSIYQRTFGIIGTKPETKLGIFGTEQVKEGSYLGRVLTGALGAEIADTDKMGYPIYEMYNQTHNSDLVPPTIPKTISVDGKNVKLTYDQQRELTVLIGSTRIEFVGAFLNNQAALYTEETGWAYMNQMTPEQIAEALKSMYDKGGDLGREKFKLLYPEFQSQTTQKSDSRTPTPSRDRSSSQREGAQPNR